MYKNNRYSKLKFIEEILKLDRKIKNAPSLDQIKKMDNVKFEKILKFLWDNLTKKEKNKVLNSLPKNVLKEILLELSKKDEKEKKGIPYTNTLSNYAKKDEKVVENIVLLSNEDNLAKIADVVFSEFEEEKESAALDILSTRLSKKVNADPGKIKNILNKTIVKNLKKKKEQIKEENVDDKRLELQQLEAELNLIWTDLVLRERYIKLLEKEEKELFEKIYNAYKTNKIEKVDVSLEENKPPTKDDKIKNVLYKTLDNFLKKNAELNISKNDLELEKGILKTDFTEQENNLDECIKNNLIKIVLINKAIELNGKQTDNEIIKDIIDKAKNTDLDSIDFEIKDDYEIEDEEIEKIIDKRVKVLNK